MLMLDVVIVTHGVPTLQTFTAALSCGCAHCDGGVRRMDQSVCGVVVCGCTDVNSAS